MKIYYYPNGQLILEQLGPSNYDDDDEEDPLSSDSSNDHDDKDKKKSRGSDGSILMRIVNDRSYAFGFLRAAYTLMAVTMGGFLFILGVNLLLYVFIDLATRLGVTDNGDLEVVNFLGALLSVPIYVYSLAMGMTLCGAFVRDTYYGHPFLRSFGMGIATTDWIAFTICSNVPWCPYDGIHSHFIP